MKNILKYLYIFVILLLTTTPQLSAQSASFRGLSTSEKLTELIVNAIYKDSIGFVWLGTDGSVERFDGVHIKHYEIDDANTKSRRVNAFAELPGNDIWAGNNTGLWRLNKETETFDAVAREILNCPVKALLYDRDGTLYAGTELGLYVYKGGKMERLLPNSNTLSKSNIITGLAQGEEGTIWLSTEGGLFALQTTDKGSTVTPHPLPDIAETVFNNITYMDSTVYLGTRTQGIVRYDTRTGRATSYVDVGCDIISTLSCDKEKQLLYVGTDGNGVHFIDVRSGTVVRSLRHEVGNSASIRSNGIYSLLVDREGIIWIGFFQMGLDYTLYQNGFFTTYAFPPQFDSKGICVQAITINGSEKLIGSRDGLFYIDERKGIYKSFHKPELRSDLITCTLLFEGEYYIGTYGGGMHVLNPKTLKLRDFEPKMERPFLKGDVFSIKQEGNQLWLGTSEGLFCYSDGKLITHFTKANSKLPDNAVYTIFFDSTHKGWIGTEKGLCIWDPSYKTLRTDAFPENFIHKKVVSSIYEDSDHNLYLLLGNGQIIISDLYMRKFAPFAPGSMIDGKVCLFVTEDDNKQLWIGTNKGLYSRNGDKGFVSYTFMDGVPSPVFFGCLPQKANGRLWIGNTKGLISTDLTKYADKVRLPYAIGITEVLINGKPTSAQTFDKESGMFEIKAAIAQKSITFCLSDFSYTDPASVLYEYRLDGVDKQWNTLDGKSEITFYDLPSGTYNLKIRRADDYESEVSVRLHVIHYISGWTMAALAIALLIGVVVYFKLKDCKNKRVTNKKTASPSEEETVESEEPTSEIKYKVNKLSEEECAMWKEKLERLMEDKKPYKNPNLKLGELADQMGMSLHNLSYLFNSYLNCKYNDYINNYRVEEFKRLVDQNEYGKYTLETMSEQCGFNSKTSFFRNFKRVEGITPNEYVRSIGKTGN